jgi:dolichol-phosphate mannosyltransferase
MPSRGNLIFVPTYNESKNAERLCADIHNLGLDSDILFVDDNSPDGTGAVLESLKVQYPRLIVHHRAGKLGIGSAHAEAIRWAYDQGYTLMLTMDGDFSHSPTDIPAMLKASENSDVVVGSRWLSENSLPGWNLYRKFMTTLGHFLTKYVLGVPQDASGAFRVYRLDRLAREAFTLVESRGYSFFFESLFILHRNGYRIFQVPIVLPARTYGQSKMQIKDIWNGGLFIFQLRLRYQLNRAQFLLNPLKQ